MPRFQEVLVLMPRIDPVETRLVVVAAWDEPLAGLSLQGRLTGPRSMYTTTLEADFALREEPVFPGVSAPTVVQAGCRLLDVNFWEPLHPFLYEGSIELWRAEEKLDELFVSVGVRHVAARDRQLWLNGQPWRVQGVRVRDNMDYETAAGWREAGCNAVMGSSLPQDTSRWGLVAVDLPGVGGPPSKRTSWNPSRFFQLVRVAGAAGGQSSQESAAAVVRRSAPLRLPAALVSTAELPSLAALDGFAVVFVETQADSGCQGTSLRRLDEFAAAVSMPLVVLAGPAGEGSSASPSDFAAAVEDFEAALGELAGLAGLIV